jgi:hypothetical protein
VFPSTALDAASGCVHGEYIAGSICYCAGATQIWAPSNDLVPDMLIVRLDRLQRATAGKTSGSFTLI